MKVKNRAMHRFNQILKQYHMDVYFRRNLEGYASARLKQIERGENGEKCQV